MSPLVYILSFVYGVGGQVWRFTTLALPNLLL